MGYGVVSKFTKTMASGDSLTGAFDLGRAWGSVYVLVPTMSTAAAIKVYGSADNTTFSIVCHPPINSSTVTTNDFVIASGAAGRWVPAPNGFRYLKFWATAAVDNGAEFSVVCSDE